MTGLRPRLRAPSALVVLTSAGGFSLLWLDGLTSWTVAAAIGVVFLAFGTWRLRSEQAAMSDRARLARLIDSIPLATVVFAGDSSIVTWNRAAAELFGWSAEEVVGLQNPIVPQGDGQRSDELARRITAGETLRGVEVERYARDGTALNLALYSAPVRSAVDREDGFLIVYDNITERKRVERERDAAQRRYQDLIEALPLVTYIDDTDEVATNIYTSPQIETLLGWSPAEYAANPHGFADLVHRDDRARVMELVAQHNRERTLFEAEYRLRHRDGHYVWVRDHSLVVEDDSGQTSARGFLLDITTQKELEERLGQAQKLDALGQFAGGVAHDFNNLLTAIGGYADLAVAVAGSAAEQPLAGIKTAATEAAALTSQLLAFSRRHVVERKLLDLNEIVRRSVTQLEGRLGDGVSVAVELDESLPALLGDPAQLAQVVANLALNGSDAMAHGGVLTFETTAAGTSVVLRVSDTGAGMDAEERLRATEPFFTTKGDGTGLGLSVVYGIVNSLGGVLALESEPGRGTTAEVTLPAAPRAEPGSQTRAEAHAPSAHTTRVLVVEDREVVRNLTRDVLEGAGFDVVTAASGPEALTVATGSAPFDLLVSDVVMPEMSGPVLATSLRELQPALRVLFMSGFTDDVLDAGELERADTAFLRKPFGNDELVGALRELLENGS